METKVEAKAPEAVVEARQAGERASDAGVDSVRGVGAQPAAVMGGPGATTLVVRDVRFGYARRREVLHGVSAEMRAGQLTAIVGPNGCGKTTLVKCVDRINRPWAGSIELVQATGAGLAGTGTNAAAGLAGMGANPAAGLAGTGVARSPEVSAGLGLGDETGAIDLRTCPLPRLARLVGYVPQRPSTELSGTVVDYLLLGRRQFLSWRLDQQDLAAVMGVMERLGISDLANEEFAELSGGQRQKVLVARALLQEPRVLLFDEPTSSLDIKNQREIMDLAAALAHDEGKVVVVVLHDLNAALAYADQAVLLHEGRVVGAGQVREVLTPATIARVYDTEVEMDAHGRVDPFFRR